MWLPSDTWHTILAVGMNVLLGSGTFDLQKAGRLLSVYNKDTRQEDIRFTTLVIEPAEQDNKS
jgi:hypothetical protein